MAFSLCIQWVPERIVALHVYPDGSFGELDSSMITDNELPDDHVNASWSFVAIGEMLIHGGTYNALVFMTGVLVIPGEHSPSFFNSQLDFQQRMLDLSPGFIHALGPSSLAAECSTLVRATL